MYRQKIIQQLRKALHQVESPRNETVEFDIADTKFSFEFVNVDQDACGCEAIGSECMACEVDS